MKQIDLELIIYVPTNYNILEILIMKCLSCEEILNLDTKKNVRIQ